jgi:hypothetical protein
MRGQAIYTRVLRATSLHVVHVYQWFCSYLQSTCLHESFISNRSLSMVAKQPSQRAKSQHDPGLKRAKTLSICVKAHSAACRPASGVQEQGSDMPPPPPPPHAHAPALMSTSITSIIHNIHNIHPSHSSRQLHANHLCLAPTTHTNSQNRLHPQLRLDMPWACNAANAADGKQNCNTPPPAMHVTQNHTTQAVLDVAQSPTCRKSANAAYP